MSKRPRLPDFKRCEQCNGWIITYNPRQIYCDSYCRNKAARARRAARARQEAIDAKERREYDVAQSGPGRMSLL